jgi:hypothetical protein
LGGGSMLPEIKNALKEKIATDSKGFSPFSNVNIEMISGDSFLAIKNQTHFLNNSQAAPVFLICYN